MIDQLKSHSEKLKKDTLTNHTKSEYDKFKDNMLKKQNKEIEDFYNNLITKKIRMSDVTKDTIENLFMHFYDIPGKKKYLKQLLLNYAEENRGKENNHVFYYVDTEIYRVLKLL